MSDLHRSGISHERFDRLIRAVEKRIPKTTLFYIGRTNALQRRRDQHYEWGGRDFDCMVEIDNFKSHAICAGVEAELINHFRRFYRCDNIASDARGGWGSGPQYIYLMWAER